MSSFVFILPGMHIVVVLISLNVNVLLRRCICLVVGMKHLRVSPEFCWGLTLLLERTYLDDVEGDIVEL